ncbi:hypothetical protein D3C83_246860 [compost metagenome]
MVLPAPVISKVPPDDWLKEPDPVVAKFPLRVIKEEKLTSEAAMVTLLKFCVPVPLTLIPGRKK